MRPFAGSLCFFDYERPPEGEQAGDLFFFGLFLPPPMSAMPYLAHRPAKNRPLNSTAAVPRGLCCGVPGLLFRGWLS